MHPFDKREQARCDIERIIGVLQKASDPNLLDVVSYLQDLDSELETLASAARPQIERALEEFNSLVERNTTVSSAFRIVLDQDLARIALEGVNHFAQLSRQKALSDDELQKKNTLEADIRKSQDRIREEFLRITHRRT